MAAAATPTDIVTAKANNDNFFARLPEKLQIKIDPSLSTLNDAARCALSASGKTCHFDHSMHFRENFSSFIISGGEGGMATHWLRLAPCLEANGHGISKGTMRHVSTHIE